MESQAREWASADALSAIQRVLGTVPSVAASLLSLTFVAYILGWFIADNYFGVFGAPWVVPLLGTRRLLNFAAFPVVFFALSTLLLVSGIEASDRELRHVSVTKWILLLLSASGTVVWLLTYGSIGALAQKYLAFGSAVGWVIVASIYLATAALAFHRSGRKSLMRSELYGLLLLVLVTFLNLPMLIGRGLALDHRDDVRSPLPRVQLVDAPVGDWRLLTQIGSHFYITDISSDIGRVRVVAADDLVEVTGY